MKKKLLIFITLLYFQSTFSADLKLENQTSEQLNLNLQAIFVQKVATKASLTDFKSREALIRRMITFGLILNPHESATLQVDAKGDLLTLNSNLEPQKNFSLLEDAKSHKVYYSDKSSMSFQDGLYKDRFEIKEDLSGVDFQVRIINFTKGDFVKDRYKKNHIKDVNEHLIINEDDFEARASAKRSLQQDFRILKRQH